MDIDNPKITVLMAVYNGERYLKRAIDSILSQAFKDFEFLIVNDCSTDNTTDIIKSYNDKRIRLHNNEINLGQTKSLNIGLRLAKGEYVARMDADDYSMPERLEKQYRYITEHPEYTVVSTDCLVINDSNNKKRVCKLSSIYEDIIVRMLTDNPLSHVSVIMEKDAIINVGGYNPEYKIAADFELWSKLIRKGYKVTNLHEILTAYTVSEGSYSRRNRIKAIEEVIDIVYGNIRALTDCVVDKEFVKQLKNMFLGGLGNMSDESILKTEGIYKNVIMHLNPELGVKIKKRKIKNILSKNYWLTAYQCMLDKKNENARRIIYKCIRTHGFSLTSMAIYILTFFNVGTIVKRMSNLRAIFLQHLR